MEYGKPVKELPQKKVHEILEAVGKLREGECLPLICADAAEIQRVYSRCANLRKKYGGLAISIHREKLTVYLKKVSADGV